MSTTIAMCQHLTVHAKRKKEKIIDCQSLTYVVRRLPKTKSSCVVGSLRSETLQAFPKHNQSDCLRQNSLQN